MENFDGFLVQKYPVKNIEVREEHFKSKLHRNCAAGFAIGSPISPRNENASDQVRDYWVIAANV